jgi:hypothetical protein
MWVFPKSFFQLQLTFVKKIRVHHHCSLIHGLFLYTCFYVRALGFSDKNPPTEKNKGWQEIIKNLPVNQKHWAGYFYQKYVDYEKVKPKRTNQKVFGCFGYSWHQDKNAFELHFHNSDPKGNLSKDRVQARTKELRQMFKSMKSQNKPTAKVFMRSWLQNINSFKRLFPEKFSEAAKPWNKQQAQDLSHWGQFVDRSGKLKRDLAEQLMRNAEKKRTYINDYFPLPCLIAEVDQNIFYKFYKLSN